MEINEALRRFRKTFKVTQKQAASAGGIAERLYQSYEYGKVVPSVTFFVTLAEYYNVSIDYLVGLSDNPNRS